MPRISERALLFLVGAVQFVNVLDFMMVMPLGPDFAAGLGIPASQLGLVGGAYTAAAAVAGIAGASFLDRFDRRSALGVAMVGLVLGTIAGGFSTGLASMVGARAIAGAFGGPATALTIAIVSDAIPAERRGKALGKVMGAFTISSVLGVPAGLELARLGTWRTPFFAVAAVGLLVAGASIWLMPRLRAHLDRLPERSTSSPSLLRSPAALLSLAATGVAMASGFALIPHLATWFQFNLGYPRERLGVLYMVAGALTFFTLRLAGRMVDRYGAPRVAAAGTAVIVGVLAIGFGWPPAGLPVVPLFAAFMIGNSTRNVSVSALSTRVPSPAERARFLSAQSAVQHLASAAGAALSSQLLHVEADGRLGGMRGLATLSIVGSLTVPALLAAVVRRLPSNERVDSGSGSVLSSAMGAGTTHEPT
ncbi:MAG TPA: MFS transporter [Anaeromyxobacteraceae bacterium]|nr:MFS transporter [Anaeromyxobacteraceae bacterium]